MNEHQNDYRTGQLNRGALVPGQPAPSYGITQAGPIQPTGPIAGAMNRADATTDAFSQKLTELDAIVSRIVGSAPPLNSGVDTGRADPNVPTVAQAMNAHADRLQNLVGVLSDHIDRLRGAF